jgi:hypothetical protein
MLRCQSTVTMSRSPRSPSDPSSPGSDGRGERMNGPTTAR